MCNPEVNSENSQAVVPNSRPVCNTAMNYRLEAVWPEPSEAVQQEVAGFWLAEAALPDLASAQERVPQLLVVASDSNGQVAGVSTVVQTFVALLGFECFYYRTFIGRAHRARGLRSTDIVWKIGRESYRILNKRFQQGYDPEVLCMYVEIENSSLMTLRNEAVWQENGMNIVYIGRTQDGRHLRVWYFDGARIP